MAFTKATWRAVEGFPENMYTGEDQAFSLALVRRGYSAALLPEASVSWRPPPTWGQNARMFFTYCRGDIRSRGRVKHAIRALAWLAAPALWRRRGTPTRALIFTGAAGYVALPVQRAWRTRGHYPGLDASRSS